MAEKGPPPPVATNNELIRAELMGIKKGRRVRNKKTRQVVIVESVLVQGGFTANTTIGQPIMVSKRVGGKISKERAAFRLDDFEHITK